MKYVRVALDVPLTTLFDYTAADVTADDIGRRVVVPFGKKIAVGVIMEVADSTALSAQRVRRVLTVERDLPRLPDDVLDLLKFCSAYYHHPLGEVVMNALPTRLRRRHALKLVDSAFALTPAGREIHPDALPVRAEIKRSLLRALGETDGAVDEHRLVKIAPGAMTALKAMMKLGWVQQCAAKSQAAATPAADVQVTSAPMLTPEQQAAVISVRNATPGFTPWLLHGVTGSGKTEVYLHLIADALARHQQVLVLVPEIN